MLPSTICHSCLRPLSLPHYRAINDDLLLLDFLQLSDWWARRTINIPPENRDYNRNHHQLEMEMYGELKEVHQSFNCDYHRTLLYIYDLNRKLTQV